MLLVREIFSESVSLLVQLLEMCLFLMLLEMHFGQQASQVRIVRAVSQDESKII